MGEIVGILLAAGFSRRFGTDKRLVALPDGTPLAVASARKLNAACAHTIVVIRPEDQALAEHPGLAGCTIVTSPQAALGMGHSLAAGVAAAPDAAGWLIALADMPYIDPATYQAVIEALQTGASVAQPTYNDRPGHPVGFAAHWRESLQALQGDVGAREVIKAAGAGRVFCPVDDPGIHRDVDRPGDL